MTANPIGAGISLAGIYDADESLPMYISGTIDAAADVFKAVTLDTSANNTVKLAGDGDPIFGVLFSIEVRTQEGITVGAVLTEGCFKLVKKSGDAIAVGDMAVGYTGGQVKKATVSTDTAGPGPTNITHASLDGTNIAVEVGTDYVVLMLK